MLPTPSDTRQFVGAHNTVDAQMHVVGSIVLFWYGKCRRLQHCLSFDMSRRLQSTLLAWPDSTVLQVCRVRSSVLRLTLSALPYLLRLISWVLIERASSAGRSQLAPTVSDGEEPRAEVRRIPGQKKRLESDCVPTLARPSDRGPNRSLGLSLCI